MKSNRSEHSVPSGRSNPSQRPSINTGLARLGLFVLSTLLCFVVLEVGLRVWFAWHQEAGLDQLSGQTMFVEPVDREVGLGVIVRPSARPGVVCELIPSVSTTFKGKHLRTNSEGYRGAPSVEHKPEGTVRIMGLGDSVMFGWGVHDDEPYLERLVEALNEKYSDVNWEGINTAVPGYNTAMEASTLESRGLKIDPDLVIVGYVGNDMFLPNFLLESRDPWRFSESALIQFLIGRSRPAAQLFNWPYKGSHLVPDSYRYMVGVEGVRIAMNRINELSRRNGFELLLMSVTHRRDRVEALRLITEPIGIPLFSALNHTNRSMSERGIESVRSPEMVVGPQDKHPSALRHAMIAEAVLEYLERTGQIRQLMTRVVNRSSAAN